MQYPPQQITRDRDLAKNIMWNLIGQGAPLIVAIFAIPVLIQSMGVDRFGVLALAWMLIGYSSLFDFGLGRAMTRIVSTKLGTADEHLITPLVWTGLFLMLCLGLIGSLVIGLLSPWLVGEVLNIPEALQTESLQAFHLISLSVPVVIITTGLRGILEAHQKFGTIIRVSIPLGVFTFLGPLLTVFFANDLFTIMAVLMLGRLIAGVGYLVLCFRSAPALRHIVMPQGAMMRPLLSFGSWMSVTNIVGPIMDYLDRFFIGTLLSVAAVTYYATPYDVATRLWMIPVAMTGVLFPAFASTLEIDIARTADLLRRGVKYIFLILFPITLLIITFAHEGLEFWLGTEFAKNSFSVLQILAVGIFINSLARLPYALVQAGGRPDITAKLHLCELPFYVLTVFWLITNFGIKGAAIAWVARVTLDTILLFALAGRFLPKSALSVWQLLLAVTSAILVFVLASFPDGLLFKGWITLVVLFTFSIAVWRLALRPDELLLLRSLLKSFRVHCIPTNR